MHEAKERVTARLTGVLTDEEGNVVQGHVLIGLWVTLTDVATGTVINGRDREDMMPVLPLTATKGLTVTETVDADGKNLFWLLEREDNVIVNNAKHIEAHEALFEWEWQEGGVSRYGSAIETIHVENLRQVA